MPLNSLGRVGIVGGLGNLGKEVTSLLVAEVGDTRLMVSGRRPLSEVGSELPNGVTYTNDNQELVDGSDTIVLSVLPQQFRDLGLRIGDSKQVVSVMAGVRVLAIQRRTGVESVVRAMPSLPVGMRKASVSWFGSPSVHPNVREDVQALLSQFGDARELLSEDELDEMTGIDASAGPLLILLEALVMEVVDRTGLDRAAAERAILTTTGGIAEHILSGRDSLRGLLRAWHDMNGTSTPGIAYLRQQSMRGHIARATQLSARRAKQLGDESVADLEQEPV